METKRINNRTIMLHTLLVHIKVKLWKASLPCFNCRRDKEKLVMNDLIFAFFFFLYYSDFPFMLSPSLNPAGFL